MSESVCVCVDDDDDDDDEMMMDRVETDGERNEKKLTCFDEEREGAIENATIENDYLCSFLINLCSIICLLRFR